MFLKNVVFIFWVFVFFVIAGALLLSINLKPQANAITYADKDADRPKVEAISKSFDFGEIKVSDVKQQDFVIKNIGSKPLQILNINSSCNCTFGQVIYKDLTSKKFGMHEQSGYVTEIAPGDSASVRVTYEPAIMPVYGYVGREVYITTNDPGNQRLVFSIKATVK